MNIYFFSFCAAFIVAIVILVVVDLLWRDKVDWLKCRLCKWWAREAEDK